MLTDLYRYFTCHGQWKSRLKEELVSSGIGFIARLDNIKFLSGETIWLDSVEILDEDCSKNRDRFVAIVTDLPQSSNPFVTVWKIKRHNNIIEAEYEKEIRCE
jgi:hypothetical protein